MPAFWKVVNETSNATDSQQVKLFRAELVQPNGDLYAETGYGFASDKELDTAIPTAIADARSHFGAMQFITAEIETELPAVVSHFRRSFPDFSCNFPIYVAPSLGKLDGAGRIIDHKPALLIGIDQAAEEYSATTLPTFLTHELFHRYHQEVAGFSDDEEGRAPIWRALWAEGLATYVSMKLNPGVTLQDALILPKNLIELAQPHLPGLIADLLPLLDQTNHAVFAEFFQYHRSESAIPSRVGYYLGALVVQRLNRNFTLRELAHLQAPTVKKTRRTGPGAVASVCTITG